VALCDEDQTVVAAGKLTRAGSLPPPPSQYDGTRVNECTGGGASELTRIDGDGAVAETRLR